MRKLQLAVASLLIAGASASAATFVGSRNDFRDETIYFAMTTRFYDGDHSNNTYCWDGLKNVNDPEWRGDFKGLIKKLDYIKALGFTTVWITPVVENASGLDYHGYHAFNFKKVDPRYESEDCKFQDLIDAAHARGMKIVLDIVLNHTGNFGEDTLCPMFVKQYDRMSDLSDIIGSMKLHPNTVLPADYDLNDPKAHDPRINAMKNEDGKNHDTHNYYHHVGNEWNWDDYSRWYGQIAGDCVDLNTENPAVSNYLIDCYGKFIAMGVDGFRIDTSGHISRLTFNKAFIPQFTELAEQYKDKRNGGPFFMYGEVCARERNVTYRNHQNCSPYYYTWKESKDYAWDYSETSWDNIVNVSHGHGDHTNTNSVDQSGVDDNGDVNSSTRKSNNALLNGNEYHTPDYSQYSGFSVIDFPMHWNFRSTREAWGVHSQDNLYNDASYNVTYVDSHDYAPDGAPENQRFAQSQTTWASNLDLMFTFRGIPCVYYGSEVEFKKGCTIDKGADLALKDSGRAYFGGYIEGDVKVNDFADYTGATGNMAATLSHPLALHIQRLNQLRAAIPALRKGQYSTQGCSGSGDGNIAFKRRYTDANTDSYVLVTIGGGATFTGVLNGTYTDAITGDVKTVTDGKLSATCSGAANMRIYVLSTTKTPAPGKVGKDGKYLYDKTPAADVQTGYDGNEEPLDTETPRAERGQGGGGRVEPAEPIEPAMAKGEQAVFFENETWSSCSAYIWSGATKYAGEWPGQKCTYLGNNVFKWTYTGNAVIPEGAGVIFSLSGSNQTDDLKFVNGGYYKGNQLVKVIEGAGEIVTPPTPPADENTFVVYFDNTNTNWSKVNVWIWDKENNYTGGTWPGAEMTFDQKTGYYKYSFDAETTEAALNVIFNNGSAQSKDLEFHNYGVYTLEGFTGSYIASVGNVSVSDLRVYTVDGDIVVDAPEAAAVTVSSVSGVTRTYNVPAGRTVLTGYTPGFYIINGKKLVIR